MNFNFFPNKIPYLLPEILQLEPINIQKENKIVKDRRARYKFDCRASRRSFNINLTNTFQNYCN